MVYGGYKFIEKKYNPRETDLIALFYVDPTKGISFEKALEAIASESSVGTWTKLKTIQEKKQNKLKAKVFWYDKKKKLCKIAYPIELFELSNIPQLLSSVAGNIFGIKAVENLKLLDIKLPKIYINSFEGPEFGIIGVRNLFNVKDRPLLGSIIKPKLGLNASEHAKLAYKVWIGGVDIIKDDENLTNQPFNKFEERIIKSLEARDKAINETGERKEYMPNITGPIDLMMERAEFVKNQGGNYVMVDVVTVGFSALQFLRKITGKLKLVIHAHRAMHAAFTRKRNHGISMLVLAKLLRLVGVDQLHIGTIVGKMEGSKEEVLEIKKEIEKEIIDENIKAKVLSQFWYNIKPVFPVASGGLHPGIVEDLVRYFGKDIIIQMGGGIHGHPKGALYGAIAARQAIDAIMKGIKIKEYAKTHKELSIALKKWGKKRVK
ncbi:MAG: type III ribulose-bisphosphate carboxylase [Candidatus Pacearchaeota archaeon]